VQACDEPWDFIRTILNQLLMMMMARQLLPWLALCVALSLPPHAFSQQHQSSNITLMAHKSNDVPNPSSTLPGQCSVDQWIADVSTNACPYKTVSGCQADGWYCPSGTDCEDCDPCQASIGGYGGCSHCLSIPGCSWCKSSGLCRSTAVTELFWASTGEAFAACGTGWETDTCDASNDLVAGQSFTDPAAPHQRWFLEAINVGEAWALGYTGSGLNILFYDDGLDIHHLDFKDKYNAAGSPLSYYYYYYYYYYHHYYYGHSSQAVNGTGGHSVHSAAGHGTHGTAVAGIALAAANNEVCGVGVAHGSTVSMSNWHVTSLWTTFTHGVQDNLNHISSNSWNINACPRTAPLVTTSQPYNVPGNSSVCPFNSDAPGSPCGSSSGCMDWPGWSDSAYDSCSDYETNEWCTADGGEGPGWSSSWGSIESWGLSGVDAYDACCACGGGCSNMDWNGNSISAGCVAVIRQYCSTHLGPDKGLYDPACADHWDLWIDCAYNGLHHAYNVALQWGVNYGRGGNGIVYVFAAGNEFTSGDNVNFEGWLNSIFTISVAATALDGEHAYYSSAGAPVLLCAPGGETGNGKMPSAYAGSPDGCSSAGAGTSFSAPLVSGSVALMLEANPNLGWRDVQDILVRTAAAIDAGHSSWVTNGAGLKHSDMYGFGILDAGAAVVMARDWPGSSSKEHALLGRHIDVDLPIPSDEEGVECGVTVSATEASHIGSVEHVVIYITTEGHPVRGELRILLTSPAGTESVMAWTTSADSTPDYNNFKFMTVKNWGEAAEGTWTLQVIDERKNANAGVLVSWILAIYGKCSSSGEACRQVVMPELCTEECTWSNDGYCDDGGVDGELWQYCPFGSDCTDCGPRLSIRAFDVVDRNIQHTAGSATCDGKTTRTSTSTTTVGSSTSTSTSTGVCPAGYQQAIIDFEDLQAGTQPSQVCLSGGGINSLGWLPASPSCADTPGWSDSVLDSCGDYETYQWCTADGEEGPGWSSDWGSIESYAVNGVDAYAACCACGGGSVPTCVDSPPGWTDSVLDTCGDYGAYQWCTTDGELGPGWDSFWGSIESYADSDGVDAFAACCACGGGSQLYSGAPETVCVSLSTTGDNAGAMLFDATCGQEPGGTDSSGCSGKLGGGRKKPGDTDLFQPLQGNVLIPQSNREDYLRSEPNDDKDGGCFLFDFSTASFEGTFSDVLVLSATLLDIERKRARIFAYHKDGTKTKVKSERGENGGIQTVDVNAEQVQSLEICLKRSGAIDDISLCLAPHVEAAEETRRLHAGQRPAAAPTAAAGKGSRKAPAVARANEVEEASASATAPVIV